MLLAMNSICKIKVVFKFGKGKKKRKEIPVWIKPQQSLVETGVRTRSSLSVHQ